MSVHYGELALLVLGLYLILQSIYRLISHPLRHIPGPKLAAISYFYEFYYNCVCGGKFLFEIERMHQVYGPIVRINPQEIHISDPSFYHEIYASSAHHRDKHAGTVAGLGVPASLVATITHDHHRLRRSLLGSYFSRGSVLKDMVPLVDERIQKLMNRLREACNDQGKVVCLDDAYAGMASDIIAQYLYGRCWNCLELENFGNHIRGAILRLLSFVHFTQYAPWLVKWLRMLPLDTLRRVQPGMAAIFDITEMADVWNGELKKEEARKTEDVKELPIFHRLANPNIPAAERTPQRLQDEGILLLLAGTDTTAIALTTATFYVFENEQVLQRLRAEVQDAIPTPTSPASVPQLEKLPFLTAVIYESLRLSYGPVMRLPRVAPTETLRYEDYTIPPGTPMSSISYFIHRDPILFPEPSTFNPERWLQDHEQTDHLKRYIVNFSKGSRVCVGMSLAYAEMYLTIARLVRCFDIELHDTTIEDLKIVSEKLLPVTRRGPTRVYAKMENQRRPHHRSEFEIAVICALQAESDAVEAAFDTKWEYTFGKAAADPNTYSMGRIGRHNVVLVFLPSMGKACAASATARQSFQL
ncbi:uncharacterized protein KD926_002108 [Aspergillus affinis]|uniref:uncharacterized protein n=1 Tax=Aspergillus affinis TaxID=1070780 RepID=UPI0022FE423D|nr:uncharacterized protein KD926_002108 [Aspergillus affinis]KAI9036290.1 hypothetical protein KD926_002108 [Aspergillus affinis]